MRKFESIGEIKDAIQLLDTATVQWLNTDPPDNITHVLQEARARLMHAAELADAPLRIALVGEFNSGKTLLLNSLLDSCNFFPCLLQPTTGNVLEVRVSLRSEERPAELKKAIVTFFNRYDVKEVMGHFIKDLRRRGYTDLTAKDAESEGNLEKLEQSIMSSFKKQGNAPLSAKYACLAFLEFVIGLRFNREALFTESDERYECPLDFALIGPSLTLPIRPELSKGVENYYGALKKVHESSWAFRKDKRITEASIRGIFTMIRRVHVDVEAWSAPFGVTDPSSYYPLAFLDFPGLGAEGSSVRDQYLCMNELNAAHAILVIFNGSNPGSSGASEMINMFQKTGKMSSERTLICVNRFDEFHPLPSETDLYGYYSHIEAGTRVGFCTLLIPARNMVSGAKNFDMYAASALAYLFEEHARRSNWDFGDPDWFNDNKRQACYALYRREQEDFENLIETIRKDKSASRELLQMKKALERYLDGGGLPALRRDMVKFAANRGERLIREDALNALKAAFDLLNEIAPAASAEGKATVTIHPEVAYAAQDFCRVLELAVADTLPGGPSDYKKLKIKEGEGDITIWEKVEKEVMANIMSWPEWFAILTSPAPTKTAGKVVDVPKKSFGRYDKLKKKGVGTVPTEFKGFDERFVSAADAMCKHTQDLISKAIRYSAQRFKNHPDYTAARDRFQSVITPERLQGNEGALPLLDAWDPSNLIEEEVIPNVLSAVSDEIEALEKIRYPYDGDKPCFWNLALIIRVQVQLAKTLRDWLSRLVAAAETHFESFFVNEIMRGEIMPLVRSYLSNSNFLAEISVENPGESWEVVGQGLRLALDRLREDGEPLESGRTSEKPPETDEEGEEESSEYTSEEDRREPEADEDVPPQPRTPTPKPGAKPTQPIPPKRPPQGVKPQIEEEPKPEVEDDIRKPQPLDEEEGETEIEL